MAKPSELGWHQALSMIKSTKDFFENPKIFGGIFSLKPAVLIRFLNQIIFTSLLHKRSSDFFINSILYTVYGLEVRFLKLLEMIEK